PAGVLFQAGEHAGAEVQAVHPLQPGGQRQRQGARAAADIQQAAGSVQVHAADEVAGVARGLAAAAQIAGAAIPLAGRFGGAARLAQGSAVQGGTVDGVEGHGSAGVLLRPSLAANAGRATATCRRGGAERMMAIWRYPAAFGLIIPGARWPRGSQKAGFDALSASIIIDSVPMGWVACAAERPP